VTRVSRPGDTVADGDHRRRAARSGAECGERARSPHLRPSPVRVEAPGSALDTLCVTSALHMRLSDGVHTVRQKRTFSGAACSRRIGVGARLRRLPPAPHRAVAEWTPLSLGLWSRDVTGVAGSVPPQTPSRRLRTHWLRVAFAGLQPSREHAAGRSRRPDALARTSRPQATTQTGRRAVSARERSGRRARLRRTA